jgi:UDP-N-acetylmuramate dehydrogenase
VDIYSVAVFDVTGAALGPHTTLRLGGAAKCLVTASDQDAIVRAVRAAGDPVLVLAGGSNVVVADEGFDGTVVLLRSTGIGFAPAADDTVLMTVEAGHEWDDAVVRSLAEGLTGLEFLSGIPGSTGATPIQNVGAYGRETAEVLESVRVFDRHRDEIVEMPAAACGLAFRSSIFKRNDRYVVLAVTFRLRRGGMSGPIGYAELARHLDVAPGAGAPVGEVRTAVLGLRRGKGMVLDAADPDTWSVGSFFLNPVVEPDTFTNVRARALELTGTAPAAWPYGVDATKLSAAWLIERAGFGKGFTGGRTGVGVSTKHTLALTNRGQGTTAELLDLAREIQGGVQTTFGVTLSPEAVLVGCAL